MTRLVAALTRPRGGAQWDVVVRGTGVVALLALYPTWRWPEVAWLVAFLATTIFVNGPLSPLLPATYEPILMAAGREYHWLLVGAMGMVGTLYVEFLNYHLYRAAILHPRLEQARGARLVRRAVALFERRPFFTVWLCAWSPLPFWVVRFLAPLSRYPVRPYLWATFLGRFPRLCFFAAVGPAVPASTVSLLGIAAAMVAVAVVIAIRRWPRNGALAP